MLLTRSITITLAATVLIGCSGSSEPKPAFAGTLFCPSGGTGSYGTLNEAVAATAPGGQIVVCDGTWDLDDQQINKPLTLRSQHAGGATIRDVDTLRSPQRGRPAIRVDGIPSGTVRFVDLTFRIGGRGVLASGEVPGTTRDSTNGVFDHIVFDSLHWISRSPSSAIGVEIKETTVPTAKVEYLNSDATDMYIAFWIVSQVEAVTSFSTFTRSTTAGPDYSGFPAIAGGSYGSITDNTFHQCGAVGCIRVPGGGTLLIARNTMDGTPGVSSLGGIVLIRTNGSGPTGVLTIQDNTVNGATIAGATGGGAWTFQAGITLTDWSSIQHVITGNKINNVYTGIVANANATASNNVIAGATYGVSQSSLNTMLFNRNDVTGATTSFQGPGGPGNYTCNWWGQASGPILPSGNVASTLYTPFATAKIAGTTTPCP